MGNCYFVPETILPKRQVFTVIDCGANVGIASIFFASHYPGAKIFSIEPHPENFSLLMRNTQSWGDRIVPIHAAVVGQPRASVHLSMNQPAWGNRLSPDEGIEVPAVTISQICSDFGLQDIDLLKVDIEAAEEEVFANAEFLPRTKLGLIELHKPYTRQKFDADLSRWHYCSVPLNPDTECTVIAFRKQPC
jgi:FkbM family methyltransferase